MRYIPVSSDLRIVFPLRNYTAAKIEQSDCHPFFLFFLLVSHQQSLTVRTSSITRLTTHNCNNQRNYPNFNW